MTIDVLLIVLFICAICKCIMFRKRNIKGFLAFIPAVNKYYLGKLINSKKLGLFNAISHTIFWIVFIFCFSYEFYIIENFADTATISSNYLEQSIISVSVPESVANMAVYSKYVLIVIGIITIIGWAIMMWKFTMQHEKSPWWIIAWVVCPVVAYLYFTALNTFTAIDGKKYTIKKVEVDK